MTSASLPALPGIWTLIRAETDGTSAAELVDLRVHLELTAVTYVVRFAGQIADRGTYTFSAPDILDLTGIEGPNTGRTIPAIFQLVGDRLRINYGLDGTRPTTFTAPAGQARYLATYKRQRN